MERKDVDRHLKQQDGVISRRQVLAAKGTDNDIERLVRRREWARVHSGVYVDHTGPLTWEQRAWAAVLTHEPAALSRDSALHAWGLRSGASAQGEEGPIWVAIAATRCVDPADGVRVERLQDFADAAMLDLSPPRLRLERALLSQAASRPRVSDAVAVLSDACQGWRTTPARLVTALEKLPRLR